MWWRKPKILIVEDSPMNHQLFQSVYEQAGFDVLLCLTAEGDFVNRVADFKPDVISMDLMIGQTGVEVKHDGLSAIRLLKADDRTKQIPIIVVSNFSGREKVAEAKSLGIIDYYNLQGRPITKIAERFKAYVDSPRRYKPTHPMFREQ